MTDPTQEHESSAEGAAATARRGAIQSGDKVRQMFDRINSVLDDLSRRVAAVEAEIFGTTPDEPQPDPVDR